jgi:hypothetical protein
VVTDWLAQGLEKVCPISQKWGNEGEKPDELKVIFLISGERTRVTGFEIST